MGACLCTACTPPGEDLSPLSDDEMKRLQARGFLPCVATPSVDFDGKNQLSCLYVAEYENGAEWTFLFLDEDRPNACQDCCYDYIRRPLFGRFSDIETVFVVDDKVEFPGTYSADQAWRAKVPSHNDAAIELARFEKHEPEDDGSPPSEGQGQHLPILWVNTWNHLFGEKNNNTNLEITYMCPKLTADGGKFSDFLIRKGTRAEVDARFRGVITSVSTVMTEERQRRLGKRLL